MQAEGLHGTTLPNAVYTQSQACHCLPPFVCAQTDLMGPGYPLVALMVAEMADLVTFDAVHGTDTAPDQHARSEGTCPLRCLHKSPLFVSGPFHLAIKLRESKWPNALAINPGIRALRCLWCVSIAGCTQQ